MLSCFVTKFLFSLFLFLICTWTYGDCLSKNQVLGSRLPLVTLAENQTQSDIDVDSFTGNYFLVWQQNPGRIKGRLLGSRGQKISPIQSFDGDTKSQFTRIDGFPRVVFNSLEREYLIVWGSSFVDSNFNVVGFENRGQFVSIDGLPKGVSFIIFQSGVSIRNIIHNRISNEYAVLYSTVSSAGTDSKLFLQRLNGNSALIGSAVQINFLTGTNVIRTDLKHDFKSNRYLVAWDASSTDPSHARFQMLTFNLKKIGIIKEISPELSRQPAPLIVYDSKQNRFLIIWRGETELKVRSVNSKGIIAPNISSLGKRGNLAAGYNAMTGETILAYFKNNRGLYLARIDQNLKTVGNDFLASCQVDNRVSTPINILFNPVQNEFFVNWSYIDLSPKSWDIYGQRIRVIPLEN